jgi:glycerophosphoryl diester phosphodiesterase
MIFKKQMIVAHRGAKGLVEHENTIDAFAKAIEVGADCIECDIRKTKDNKIIVFHDDAINDQKIKDLTYQELLEVAGFKVPTLEETLEFVKGKILIDIEFKESGYVEEALQLIHKYLSNSEFFIRSFNDDVIVDAKIYDEKITCALLLGKDIKTKVIATRLSELFPGRRIKKCGCDFVSPHYRLLKFGFMWRMKLKGKPVSVWTVNDEELMKKLLFKKKVHALVTDYPNKALELLKAK